MQALGTPAQQVTEGLALRVLRVFTSHACCKRASCEAARAPPSQPILVLLPPLACHARTSRWLSCHGCLPTAAKQRARTASCYLAHVQGRALLQRLTVQPRLTTIQLCLYHLLQRVATRRVSRQVGDRLLGDILLLPRLIAHGAPRHYWLLFAIVEPSVLGRGKPWSELEDLDCVMRPAAGKFD